MRTLVTSEMSSAVVDELGSGGSEGGNEGGGTCM